MVIDSCQFPDPCDCLHCEIRNLENSMKDSNGELIRQVQTDVYTPKSTTERAGKQINLIIPMLGDYMVATLAHFNSLKKAGYKLNGGQEPHDRMQIMYIGTHGLSQCGWGSPAQTEGRAIHSTWPGEWELGLTPLDNVHLTPQQRQITLYEVKKVKKA